jgi:hypothetical protein
MSTSFYQQALCYGTGNPSLEIPYACDQVPGGSVFARYTTSDSEAAVLKLFHVVADDDYASSWQLLFLPWRYAYLLVIVASIKILAFGNRKHLEPLPLSMDLDGDVCFYRMLFVFLEEGAIVTPIELGCNFRIS